MSEGRGRGGCEARGEGWMSVRGGGGVDVSEGGVGLRTVYGIPVRISSSIDSWHKGPKEKTN